MVDTLLTAFRESVDSYGERKAIISNNREISYKELDEKSDALARALIEKDIKKGDRIATILPNGPEFAFCYLAAAKIGAILVPLNIRYRSDELEYMVSKCDASVVISIDEFGGTDFRHMLDEFIAEIESIEFLTFVGETLPEKSVSFEELLEMGQEVDPDLALRKSSIKGADDLIIIYTSGTTGRPKPALSTNENVLSNSLGHIKRWNLSPDDVGLMAVPNNHVGGANVIVATCLIVGATVRTFEEFDPRAVLRSIDGEGGSFFNGVPVMYSDLINHDDFETFDVSAFRLGVVGGSSPSPELVKNSVRKLGGRVVQGWGMSEVSGYALSTFPDDPAEIHATTIGVPMDAYDVNIVAVDNHTEEVGHEEVGELVIKGPGVFKEYLSMPEATEESFTNGWFGTGDLVRETESGYIQFVDRKGNMFVSGGYNIYPKEIENYLGAHESVDQACIVGVEDDRWGEVGWCFVKPFDDLSEEELRDYCRDHFADYKIPKKFITREELPLTPANKIAREELRIEAEEIKNNGNN